MKLTTDSLYRRMEQAYFDSTGCRADSASDVGLRFRLLAGELYSLYLHGAHILKQAFPQTAEGDYLDLQADARGIYRRSSSAANGWLVFSVESPAEAVIEVPVGTVCACGAEPYLRYSTVSGGKIQPGSTDVRVAARALGTGESYNVPTGSVTLMVTPPAGVSSVTNTKRFTGGYSGEDDKALRHRLLAHMRFRPNGFDRESYASRLLTLEEVVDVNTYRSEDGESLSLAVRTKEGILDAELRRRITALLTECLLTPMQPKLLSATAKPIPVRVVVMPETGYDTQTVLEEVRALVQAECGSFPVGGVYDPAHLAEQMRALDGVKDCILPDGTAPVPAGASEYLTASPVEVTADAW